MIVTSSAYDVEPRSETVAGCRCWTRLAPARDGGDARALYERGFRWDVIARTLMEAVS